MRYNLHTVSTQILSVQLNEFSQSKHIWTKKKHVQFTSYPFQVSTPQGDFYLSPQITFELCLIFSYLILFRSGIFQEKNHYLEILILRECIKVIILATSKFCEEGVFKP